MKDFINCGIGFQNLENFARILRIMWILKDVLDYEIFFLILEESFRFQIIEVKKDFVFSSNLKTFFFAHAMQLFAFAFI